MPVALRWGPLSILGAACFCGCQLIAGIGERSEGAGGSSATGGTSASGSGGGGSGGGGSGGEETGGASSMGGAGATGGTPSGGSAMGGSAMGGSSGGNGGDGVGGSQPGLGGSAGEAGSLSFVCDQLPSEAIVDFEEAGSVGMEVPEVSFEYATGVSGTVRASVTTLGESHLKLVSGAGGTSLGLELTVGGSGDAVRTASLLVSLVPELPRLPVCFDASAYRGITFWARGPAQTHFSNAVVFSAALDPAEVHASDVELALTDAWQEFTVEWDDLTTPEAFESYQPEAFSFFALQIGTMSDFVLAIDEVAFIPR